MWKKKVCSVFPEWEAYWKNYNNFQRALRLAWKKVHQKVINYDFGMSFLCCGALVINICVIRARLEIRISAVKCVLKGKCINMRTKDVINVNTRLLSSFFMNFRINLIILKSKRQQLETSVLESSSENGGSTSLFNFVYEDHKILWFSEQSGFKWSIRESFNLFSNRKYWYAFRLLERFKKKF